MAGDVGTTPAHPRPAGPSRGTDPVVDTDATTSDLDNPSPVVSVADWTDDENEVSVFVSNVTRVTAQVSGLLPVTTPSPRVLTLKRVV